MLNNAYNKKHILEFKLHNKVMEEHAILTSERDSVHSWQ